MNNKKVYSVLVLFVIVLLLVGCAGGVQGTRGAAIDISTGEEMGSITVYDIEIRGMPCVFVTVGGDGSSGLTCDFDQYNYKEVGGGG